MSASMNRSARRGNYSMIFGISAIMLLGFTALGVDTGWQRVAMTQLHNAADAGAHAGALELNGTLPAIAVAKQRALDVAQANLVHGSNVILSANDVEVGRFDLRGENGCSPADPGLTGCWTDWDTVPSGALYDPDINIPVDETSANAVYVQAGEQVSTFFSAFPFGVNSLSAANWATARLPILMGEECAFPMVLPQCGVTERGGSAPCGQLMRIRLSSSQADNAAMATPFGQSGADVMRQMMADEDGNCTASLSQDETPDTDPDMTLNNGSLTSVMQILDEQVDGGTWSGDLDGDGSSETYDYSGNIQAWDTNWGACPTLDSTTCDTTKQGICACSGCASSASESQSACNTAGGSWSDTCPSAGPNCTDATNGFVRREMAVFDSSTHGMGCDGVNGNPDSAMSSYNWNTDIDATGYVTVIIYDVRDSGNPKYIDVYVTCNDEDGVPMDEDNDGVPDAVHRAWDQYIDPPDGGGLSMVQ